MSVYAEGIERYVEIGNHVMPFGYHEGPLDEQRRMFARYAIELPFGQPDEVSHIDTSLGDVPCRRYMTKNSNDQHAIVYFHGGGFVLGGIDSHDDLARSVCHTTDTTVFLIDYRLAPEHPCPMALQDALAATTALLERQVDVVLAGESSGANIAVYVGRTLAKTTLSRYLRKVALFCPVLNFARWSSGGEDAPRLSGDEMKHFVECYTTERFSPESIAISPLLHDHAFDHFVPTYIGYASEDSLNVDAIQLADSLHHAGIDHDLNCHHGLVHACLRARTLSSVAEEAFQNFCSGMRYE